MSSLPLSPQCRSKQLLLRFSLAVKLSWDINVKYNKSIHLLHTAVSCLGITSGFPEGNEPPKHCNIPEEVNPETCSFKEGVASCRKSGRLATVVQLIGLVKQYFYYRNTKSKLTSSFEGICNELFSKVTVAMEFWSMFYFISGRDYLKKYVMCL